MNLTPIKRVSYKHPREDRSFVLDLYNSWEFCEFLNQRQPELATRFIVNIGAGDGKSYDDPCYPLFQRGYKGVAIDGANILDLAKNLPQPEIQKLIGCIVTPLNVASLLDRCGTPKDLDYLKIDIDGYDGDVLNAILAAGYRPKVLQAEINPEIPPPIEFSVMYHPNYRCQDSGCRFTGFYGMSMAFLARIARRYGYHVVYMDSLPPATHDLVLVKNELAPILGSDTAMDSQSLRCRYLAHPLPDILHFPDYGIDSFAWRYRTDYPSLANDVWNSCIISSANKHAGVASPFYFGVSE